LLESDWQKNIQAIEKQLKEELAPCSQLNCVKEVRTKGAIGVVELHEAIDTAWSQPLFSERGVWLRPFGKLVYLMPPFIIEKRELSQLTKAIFEVLEEI